MLRAVVNSNTVVIADYNGVGTWGDFSYETYPAQTQDVLDYIAAQPPIFAPMMYKVVSGAIALRTITEIQAQPYGV